MSIEVPPPDEEERYLEKLVFGDAEGFDTNLKQVDNLFDFQDEETGLFEYDTSEDEDLGFELDHESSQDSGDDEEQSDDNNMDAVADADLYFVDESDEDKMDTGSDSQESDSASEYSDEEAVWQDSDDEKVTVSLLDRDNLRKLRHTPQDSKIRGKQYLQRLREQFERIHPRPAWADSVESGSEHESDAEDDARGTTDVLGSSNPLLEFLKSNQSYNLKAEDVRLLPAGKIDISRLTDANIKKISKSAVQTLSFHQTQPLLMTGGYDRTLRIFHIDGKTNNLVTSLHLRNSPIQTAVFDQDTIFAGGRRRFMHKWDVASGAVEKISRMYGHEATQRSFEHFKLSRNGKYIGLAGNSGWINVISPKTGIWLKGFKIEGTLVDFDFSQSADPTTPTVLVAVNKAGDVWEFDVESGASLDRWTDESGLGITRVRFGGHNTRWLAIGNNVGIVNVYDRLKQSHKPAVTIENLVTTVSSIEFTSDAQLLCVASRDKKDALRLVHLPSGRVFSNWPTSGTPLGRVTSVAFSPNNELLATGNESGKVRLWRLNHY
ncbi:hypothetical protein OGAPHI_004581 [Ogataea philodendri]|uniref:U3 small nucleolar RNA-associated protein 18 n=1 Tax=Ogataea philodendri TaxID=1378263 RepID=A0A9P8P2W4_9ASCO|nr:uncharacterized protein OGAPHI_004581 [Ogataea philodendri]KAH3664230.1 hypothetical protein OGAPHI_004581 [Ogataea philodendri]